ncbi:MAG: hypothetical protein VYD51_07960 [Bacteroidota bacterium]|nr:hypothetical protein [Bacteroidota bacterium]
MEPLDIQDVQKQLSRCQHALDQARQHGWDTDLIREFEEATRHLHEGAIMRRHLNALEEQQRAVQAQAEQDEPPAQAPPVNPVNRLLTAEKRGEPDTLPEQQVDLLSSIGELTLAEKLALQPLSSVAEGMSILDRAQFTSVLFSGEEKIFSALLAKLERAATQEEAMALFQETLSPRGEDAEVEQLQEAFAKRIVRTFVS